MLFGQGFRTAVKRTFLKRTMSNACLGFVAASTVGMVIHSTSFALGNSRKPQCERCERTGFRTRRKKRKGQRWGEGRAGGGRRSVSFPQPANNKVLPVPPFLGAAVPRRGRRKSPPTLPLPFPPPHERLRSLIFKSRYCTTATPRTRASLPNLSTATELCTHAQLVSTRRTTRRSDTLSKALRRSSRLLTTRIEACIFGQA